MIRKGDNSINFIEIGIMSYKKNTHPHYMLANRISIACILIWMFDVAGTSLDRHLDLSRKGLTEIPEEIMKYTNLEELNLIGLTN